MSSPDQSDNGVPPTRQFQVSDPVIPASFQIPIFGLIGFGLGTGAAVVVAAGVAAGTGAVAGVPDMVVGFCSDFP